MLSFYYLCRTGNNGSTANNTGLYVVICFHFTIFVVLGTTQFFFKFVQTPLWFAFILLSLSYWEQHENAHCVVNAVVICFHFTIFVVLGTTTSPTGTSPRGLWFAFILLSLSYWEQLIIILNNGLASCDLLSFYYLCRTGNNLLLPWCIMCAVVICFHFTIFVVLGTTCFSVLTLMYALWFAFILLSLSYWEQHEDAECVRVPVVICFHFTIFVVLGTTYW